MKMQEKPREYLFDNYKGLLILLIIIGHFTDLNYRNNTFLYLTKWVIYAFHVPAFVFISGYFSRRRTSPLELLSKLIIPYLIYEIIYYVYYTYVLQIDTGIYLLYPKFSLWYLLCLFAWRLLPAPGKRHGLLFSAALLGGLLIGLSDMPDNFLSLPRMLVFLPFFLAGRSFTPELAARLRTRTGRWLCGGVLTAVILGLLVFLKQTDLSVKIFYGRYNYEFLKQTPLAGIRTRLLCYMVSFLLLFSLLGVISNKKSRLCLLGRRTMAIYIGHGFVLNYLKYRTDLLPKINTPAETALLLLTCLALALTFSTPPFTWLVTLIASLPERLQQHFDRSKSRSRGQAQETGSKKTRRLSH